MAKNGYRSWRLDRELVQLETQIAAQRQTKSEADAALPAAEAQVARTEEALSKVEARQLVGRATARDVDRARTAHEEARKARASLLVQLDDAEQALSRLSGDGAQAVREAAFRRTAQHVHDEVAPILKEQIKLIDRVVELQERYMHFQDNAVVDFSGRAPEKFVASWLPEGAVNVLGLAPTFLSKSSVDEWKHELKKAGVL